jgi:flagellar hook-basal body protein
MGYRAHQVGIYLAYKVVEYSVRHHDMAMDQYSGVIKMPVYSAFSIPTLGMRAQAHSLATIGNNIANVTTGGFKRTDTNFSTLLSNTIDKQSDIGGVKPKDLNQITQQGNMVVSNRDLDLAINGQGFFILSPTASGGGQLYYGRDGSFEMATVNDISVAGTPTVDANNNTTATTIASKDGYLVDKNGYFLQGWTADPTTGLFNNTSLSSLRIDPHAFAVSGQTTTTAALKLNLPSADSAGINHVSEIVMAGSVGVLEAGDTYSVTVDGTTVTYTTTGAEANLNAVRDAFVAAINANTTVAAGATASASTTDGKLLITGKTQGTTLTVSSATTNVGATADNTISSSTTQTAKAGDAQFYNIKVYDSNGNARSVRLDFTKTATNTWNLSTSVGKTPVAQVDTLTLAGTVEAGDVYSTVLAGTTFSVTASASDTLTTIRDALVSSINADASVKVTAASSGAAALTLTADTAGTSFTNVPSTTNTTAVAQIDNVTMTGNFGVGDTVSVNVNGIGAVPYTVIGTDLTDNGADGTGTDAIARNNIAIKLAAAVVGNAPTAAVTTASAPGGGIVALTAVTAGTAFTHTAASVTVGTGTAGSSTPTPNIAALANNTATKVNTTANVSASDTTTTSVTNLVFNSDGTLLTPTSGSVSLALTFPPEGTSPASTATVAMDISELSQFAGNFLPFSYSSNGYAAANAQSIRFDSQGHVIATFDDSTFRTVYKVPLAQFSNANALEEYNGNVYRETEESGVARVVDADKTGYASFMPSTHEISNVDLAGEFTRMMMTQTAYNSSATVFKTVDEMVSAARDLKR